MFEKASLDPADHAGALMNKKPYRRPSLQVFGALHLLTQGSNGSCPDMGNNSRREGAPPNCNPN